MTVGEVKAQLAPFSDDIIVCLEDWNEQYAPPKVLETICLVENYEYSKEHKGDSTGTIILLT